MSPVLLGTGAAGLAWWPISRSGLGDSPAAFPLRQAYRLTALQALLHDREVMKAFSFLRSAGVEPILGKGWAAARLYPDPGLRPYGDVDLYVRREQYGATRSALASSVAGCNVDLHEGFAELDDRPPAELYERSAIVALDGTQVRVFGPEDHLRLLCLHMMRHGLLRPVWLCDVAAAVEGRPRDFDWDHFTRGDRRRTEWVACALGLAHELLGASLEGVPLSACRERLPRWLIRTVLKQWGMVTVPQGARTPMADYLRHPAGVIDALRVRWPNAIEATVGVGGPMNDWPRLFFQLGASVRRSLQFVRRLPSLLRQPE